MLRGGNTVIVCATCDMGRKSLFCSTHFFCTPPPPLMGVTPEKNNPPNIKIFFLPPPPYIYV